MNKNDIDLKDHVLTLGEEGRLTWKGNRQLRNIEAAYNDFPIPNPPIAVYFHGGLTSNRDARKIASRLSRDFLEKGIFPIFVIWQTDLLTIIRDTIKDEIRVTIRELVAEISSIASISEPQVRTLLTIAGDDRKSEWLDYRPPATSPKMVEWAQEIWSNWDGRPQTNDHAEILAWHTALLLLHRVSRETREDVLSAVATRVEKNTGHGPATIAEELYRQIGITKATQRL